MALRIGPQGVLSLTGPRGRGVPLSEHWTPPSSWLHRRDLVDRIGPWTDAGTTHVPVDAEFLQRAAADGQVAFLRSTSVLKFPSQEHGAYRPGAARPQAGYLERIQADPRALERELLLELAEMLTVELRTKESAATLLRRAASRLVGTAMDRYGRERWPLSILQRRKRRESALRRQRERGLPPR
jgi:hypothetical protein